MPYIIIMMMIIIIISFWSLNDFFGHKSAKIKKTRQKS